MAPWALKDSYKLIALIDGQEEGTCFPFQSISLNFTQIETSIKPLNSKKWLKFQSIIQ